MLTTEDTEAIFFHEEREYVAVIATSQRLVEESGPKQLGKPHALDRRMDEQDPLTERIIGCAIEVHRDLGAGLLESAYDCALRIELAHQGLRFEKQKPFRSSTAESASVISDPT